MTEASEARETLAQRQEALIRALVAGGPVPAGLDPVAVAAAGQVCRHKRNRHTGSGWRLAKHR
ncbi:hypothetical protein [Mycobacterium sp. NAZ190054]|uniref:hypothetical protein n=1 Tax=Mycobacterium sp. NAZ190054 TaxID=1747766 RepID=UPI000791BCE1|nr:hypothetical protein [Mycobacterium sp. NAZ190054]KWX67289.1 hypothetical protein ASJ79_04620 [Mycobacterium sp. NAZ190054]